MARGFRDVSPADTTQDLQETSDLLREQEEARLIISAHVNSPQISFLGISVEFIDVRLSA